MSKSKLTGIAPEPDHRPLRLRRVPLLLPARDRSSAQDGSFSWEDMTRALHRRARQRLRQPRLARDRDGRQVLRRRAARGRRRTPTAERRAADAAGRDAARPPTRAIERLDFHDGDRRGVDVRRRAQRLHHRAGAVGAREGRRRSARRGSSTVLYTAAEALRALAVLLNPVMPKATATLWDALGADGALGPLADQPSATPGAGASCRAGATVTKGAIAVPAARGRPRERRREPDATGTRPSAGRSRPLARLERPPLPEPLRRRRSSTATATSRSRRRRRLDRSSTSARARRRRSASTRIVQVGCDLPSARWSVEAAAAHDARRRRRSRCTRTRRRASTRPAAGGARRRRSPRSPSSPRTRGARGRRDRARLLPHRRRTGRAVQEESFRRAHRDREGARQGAGDPRPRRARRRARACSSERGRARAMVFHCFSGDAAMARDCADARLATCRSPAP